MPLCEFSMYTRVKVFLAKMFVSFASALAVISSLDPVSFGFARLTLDNTVRDIKPQFECDLFSCFYLMESEKHSLVVHCEDFLRGPPHAAIHKFAFV